MASTLAFQLMFLQSNVENLSPQILRQVSKEIAELIKEPPEGIKIYTNDEDITDIQATIEGPGGVQVLRITCY